ncbi:MAG TPA: DUF192 domain-containing protein [Terriglobales bacterium]
MSRPIEYVTVTNTTRTTSLGDRIQVAERGLDGVIGLLGRRSLDAGQGMLIVPTQAVHTIGMAFPIDLVFIDKHNKVIATREDIPPFRISKFYWKALGVIELPIGTIRDTRTQVGDQLKVDDTELKLPLTD